MADEFVKGFGALSAAGLVWMVMAGWYRTPSFEGAQLNGDIPSSLTAFDHLAIVVMGVAFATAVVAAAAFWVVIPAGREVYAAVSEE